MIEASPDGQHMTMETFERVLPWIKDIDHPVVMLSGGEPTEHPQLIEMVDMAIASGFKTLVLSNGKFANTKVLCGELLNRDVMIQVTNDVRYYPEKYPVINHPKVVHIDSIIAMSPFGRALTNKIECNRQSPLCFNLRSATRGLKDFRQALVFLRSKIKMCTPSVNIDGSISAGESHLCTKIGMVGDSNLKLTNAVCNMRCSKCGLVDNLSPVHKEALGE
jgi:hypothetical protein